MAPSSAAIALRESFGDRKLPDITRKITACVACRKLKIKCHMTESKPPCARCTTRGLSCTVNKSIQMLLENDVSWKQKIEQKIERIERSVLAGDGQKASSSLADLSYMRSSSTKISDVSHTSRQPQVTIFHELPTASCDLTLNLSCSLGAFPASSMNRLILREQDVQPGSKQDLVSCGVLSQEAAETHFAFYRKYLDRYIYRILGDAITLADVRSRSSLLTAAVCVTAAFCAGSKDYERCFQAFTNEVSGMMFSIRHTFDDVRALCIGAFWLGNISSVLNALAVRMASELDLHRCITKMPHTKKACYERTRLYYMVFICDHNCSLSHGRPPMTRELGSLKRPKVLLQSDFSTASDLELVSQVELWSISNQVFDVFGADIQNPTIRYRSADFQRLSTAYEKWNSEWQQIFQLRNILDSFTRHAFDLYFHSAKLYLFSHVFRGPSQRNHKPPITTKGMDSLANSATENAWLIIRCITDESNSEAWLGKMPSYFSTTISFASVFLLRGAWNEEPVSNAEKDQVYLHLDRLTELLHRPSIVIHPSHPLLSTVNSLEIAIGARCLNTREEGNDRGFSQNNDFLVDFDTYREGSFDSSCLEGLDGWLTYPNDTES